MSFKKIMTLSAIVILVILCALLYVRYSKIEKSIKLNSQSARNVTLDMGEIFYGQTIKKEIKLKNVTKKPLLLKGITECGCTKIEIDSVCVEPDSEITANIKYESFLKQSVGVIKNKFLVNNEILSSPGNNIKSSVLEGTVNVFVRPTVLFTPNIINIVVSKDQDSQFDSSIEIENKGNCTINLNYTSDSIGNAILAVSPDQISIKPNEKCKVKITSPFPIQYSDMIRISNISFRGHLYDNEGKHISLQYKIPIKVLPSKLVIVKPGSLLFANAEISEAKTFHLTCLEGNEITIESVEKSDNVEVDNLEDNMFSVKLNPAKFECGTFSEEIILRGKVKNQKFVVKVPVLGLKK